MDLILSGVYAALTLETPSVVWLNLFPLPSYHQEWVPNQHFIHTACKAE